MVLNIKKNVSRKKLLPLKVNGRNTHIKPPTNATTKVAAPNRFEYMVALGLSTLARVVKRSGEPLPNANRVTPAKCSLKPITFASISNEGQKLKRKKYKQTNYVESIEAKENLQFRGNSAQYKEH